MQKLFTATFKAYTGVIHMLEIYDNASTEEDLTTEITLESPGYSLDYNAGITDVVKGGLVQSAAEFTIRNLDGVLDTFIAQLSTCVEGRFLVQIYRGVDFEAKTYPVFWRGVILTDFSERIDLPNNAYSFQATDGLALLKNKFIPAINPPAGEDYTERMICTIIKGLRQIPSTNLWNTGTDPNFVVAKTDWYGENMDDVSDPLHQAYFKGVALWRKITEKEGYNGVISEEIESMNYYEVIEHIMERFNAILMMQEGAWYIYQRDLVSEGILNFFTYRAYPQTPPGEPVWIGNPYQLEKTLVASVLPDAVVPDKRWRSQGSFSYIPGLGKVRTTYGGGNLEDGFDSIIPSGFLADQTYTTMPLSQGEGNYLHLRVAFSENYQIDWEGVDPPEFEYKAKVVYKVTIKQGSHYLTSNGGWTEIPTYITILPINSLRHIWDSGNQQWSFQDRLDYNFDMLSDDLPEDDVEVTVLLEQKELITFWGGDYYETQLDWNFNYLPDLENHFLLYIGNNDAPVTSVTFEAVNDSAFLNEFDMSPSLFGTAAVIQNSNFSSYSTGGWAVLEKWGKTYAGTKDQYFNGLLAQQILANQGKNLLMYSGTIYDRESTQMTILQAIGIVVDGNPIALHFNKVTYSAQSETWSGDWFETFALEVTPTAPIPVPRPFIAVPGLPQDISALPNFIDVGTGEIDTTEGGERPGGVISPQIRFPLIETPPEEAEAGQIIIMANQEGVPQQLNEYGVLKNVGADASFFEENPIDIFIIYGFLYNWYITQEAGLVSDTDWRVPTDTDWDALETYIQSEITAEKITADGVGGALKETGTGHWITPNTGATDEYNFTGLPAGVRDNTFANLTKKGVFWADAVDGESGIVYYLDYTFESLGTGSATKYKGHSIRLVRVATVPEQALADGTYVDNYVGNDGKIYKAVKIDEQVWLAENLCETKLSDGSPIPECPNQSVWEGLTTFARCSYDNDIFNAYTETDSLIFKDGKKLSSTQLDLTHTFTASAETVGTIRYRADANNSWCEMVMQTAAATYAWVVIKTNTW